jgi:hypothetical protein
MNRWTPEQDRLLSETYAVGGLRGAVAALGLSRSAVKNRIQGLGLKHPHRCWTPEEDAILRADYGAGESAVVLAARLDRGVPAVRRRANILGVTSGRLWKPEEVEAVRLGYRDKGCHALAVELLGSGGPVQRHAIYGLASKLGVAVPDRHGREVYDRVRELHGRGMNDGQIAKAMANFFPGRNDRERVAAIRRRMKLPAIKQTPEQMRELGRRTRAAQMAAGVNPRDQAFAKLAARYGLPPGTPPRAVEILLSLTSGPKNREDLKALTGRDPVSLWNGTGNSYLGELVRRGWIASMKLPGASNRGPRKLYLLTPVAMELLSRPGTETVR